jgi:metal-sulfur cluster biosynthetic enzyme
MGAASTIDRKAVSVKLTWNPPGTPEMMPAGARLQINGR